MLRCVTGLAVGTKLKLFKDQWASPTACFTSLCFATLRGCRSPRRGKTSQPRAERWRGGGAATPSAALGARTDTPRVCGDWRAQPASRLNVFTKQIIRTGKFFGWRAPHASSLEDAGVSPRVPGAALGGCAAAPALCPAPDMFCPFGATRRRSTGETNAECQYTSPAYSPPSRARTG